MQFKTKTVNISQQSLIGLHQPRYLVVFVPLDMKIGVLSLQHLNTVHSLSSAPMKSSSVKDKLVVPRKKAPLKTHDNATHMENIRKNGVASVELSPIYLLAGKMFPYKNYACLL